MAKKPLNMKIREVFEEVEEDFPSKSTEWLFQMTCDRFMERYHKEIDHGDIAWALAPDQ